MSNLYRAFICFLIGHYDIATFYDPITGEKDCGVICKRCGHTEISNWGYMLRNNK